MGTIPEKWLKNAHLMPTEVNFSRFGQTTNDRSAM
jgi:hypothetical protein